MSVTLTKSNGLTVFTLTSDPQRICPPLCQVLKGLCHSPVCCSVSQHLKKVLRTSMSVLGALHFLVGLLNIGLGVVEGSNGGTRWWGFDHTLFFIWFGTMFMFCGAISMLSANCPSPCLIIFNVILNIAGAPSAIAATTFYCMTMVNMDVSWMCRDSKPPRQDMDSCIMGKEQVLGLMMGITGILIILSVLEFCLTITTAVLGIKSLRSQETRENKSNDDRKGYEEVAEDVTSNFTV